MGNFGTLNSFVNTSEWLKLPGNNRLKSWVKGWTKPRCILDSWDSPNRNIGGNLKPVIHLPPWSAYFERLLVWEPPTLYPWYILVQELTGKLLTLLANGDRHWHPGYASRGQKMQTNRDVSEATTRVDCLWNGGVWTYLVRDHHHATRCSRSWSSLPRSIRCLSPT